MRNIVWKTLKLEITFYVLVSEIRYVFHSAYRKVYMQSITQLGFTYNKARCTMYQFHAIFFHRTIPGPWHRWRGYTPLLPHLIRDRNILTNPFRNKIIKDLLAKRKQKDDEHAVCAHIHIRIIHEYIYRVCLRKLSPKYYSINAFNNFHVICCKKNSKNKLFGTILIQLNSNCNELN